MSVDEYLKKENKRRWGLLKRFRKNKSKDDLEAIKKLDEEVKILKNNPEQFEKFRKTIFT